MSLNFDLTAIPLETRTIVADHDKPNPFYVEGRSKPEDQFEYRKGDRIMSGVTNALIWMCMGVGLNGITADNLEEFALRVKLLDGINGLPLTYRETPDGDYKSRSFTMRELHDHIGLRTNVSNEKRVSWLTRIAKSEEYRVKQAIRDMRDELAKETAAA